MTTANRPPTLPPCEDCGGTQVSNLNVISQHHVGLHPAGKTLWASPLVGLFAAVCLTCGRVKLLVDDLAKLRKEAQEHPEWFTW